MALESLEDFNPASMWQNDTDDAVADVPDNTSDASPSPSPAPAAAPAPVVLPPDFGQQFAESIKAYLPSQPAAASAAPLTREQAEAALDFWQPNADFFTALDDLEKRPQAFQQLRDGLTKQMVTIVRAMLGEAEQGYIKRLSPIEAHYQQQQQRQAESAFSTAYPALAAKELRPMISALAQHLSTQQFPTQEAAFKALAELAESTIKQYNPTFSLAAVPASGAGAKGKLPVNVRGTASAGAPAAPAGFNPAAHNPFKPK